MEFTLNLPDEVFMKGLNGKLEGKSILVRSCSSVFRYEFAYRRKQGYGIPLGEFMGDKAFL